VKIGEQVWMAENLNYAVKGSVCYDNKPENCDKYGRLYDWETAIKACPSGWHLPSEEEWEALAAAVGGEETAGSKLKARDGWNEDGNGTDDYGFAALPGGDGYSDGSFNFAGINGFWWSDSEYAASHAYSRLIGYYGESVSTNAIDKIYLFSVRCVKHAETNAVGQSQISALTKQEQEAKAELEKWKEDDEAVANSKYFSFKSNSTIDGYILKAISKVQIGDCPVNSVWTISPHVDIDCGFPSKCESITPKSITTSTNGCDQ
jgi:uncharacterized protein (TIGR02145 family)